MNWILLIVVFISMGPFILMWLAAGVSTWMELGWRPALRLILVTLPLMIVIGLIIYGLTLLPDKNRDVISGIVYGVLSVGTWYFIFVYLSGVMQGQEILVDSKPPNFIEVSGLRFNAITLIFGVFALIEAGIQLGRVLEATSQILVEQLRLLATVSVAGFVILRAFQRFQIRRNGIMTGFGGLLRWTIIVKYDWMQYQDKVKLEIRRWPLRNFTMILDVPAEHRTALDEYLLKYVGEAG